MAKILIKPKRIVTANSNDDILENHAIIIENSKITEIKKVEPETFSCFTGDIIEADNLTLIPGFIQTHLHLCQTLFRGMADNFELLDWLQKRIFPCENAHNSDSLKVSAQLGLYELMKGGTTTILDMGTLRHQEAIFDELIDSGIRAFAGKCMIDENDLFPSFKSTLRDEIQTSLDLASSYHNFDNGRIKYGFAPRFVLSCSEQLLRETKVIMKEFPGSVLHTHSSENKNEIAEVRRRHNRENIDYFDHIELLDDHTVLAHCVHVNDKEIKLLKEKQGRVAHCPSSNLKLASGIAPIHRFLHEGVHVSLGADGAPCNNALSMFYEMRLASLIQKPFNGPLSTNAKTVFRLATIEGAKALHIDNQTGSIEVGKKADLSLIDLDTPIFPVFYSDDAIYSSIVYNATADCVKDVMIDGKWVVRSGEHLKYESKELRSRGKSELNKLIERAQISI